jgi:hypothetical protein
VAGRPLLEYERAEVPILDPDDPGSLPRRESGVPLEGESESVEDDVPEEEDGQ